MRPQLREHLPAASRLFDMAADGAFHDIRAVSLVGPPGCCKRRIATMLAEELAMPPVQITSVDMASRVDRIARYLSTPPVDGSTRACIITISDRVRQGALEALHEYAGMNMMIYCSVEPLKAPMFSVRVNPLNLEQTCDFMKSLAKKCLWKYDKVVGELMYKITQGVPELIIDMTRSVQFCKSLREVVDAMTFRPEERKIKEFFNALLDTSMSHVDFAAAIKDLLDSVSWVHVQLELDALLRNTVLSCSEQELESGEWRALKIIDLSGKSVFVASCFELRAFIKSL